MGRMSTAQEPSTEFDDVRVTRAAYDEMAEIYAEHAANIMARKPFDRAMLDVFAEATPAGPVVEIGCGPGRIAAYLADRGLDISGIDLSPRMIELARAAYPALRFEVGSMEELTFADASLTGLVAWYSVIHLPPQRVPAVLTEFHRVLQVGGQLLIAGFADEIPDAAEPFDHRVATAYRWSPERLADEVAKAGFTVGARLVRVADPDERFLHMYLMASKDR